MSAPSPRASLRRTLVAGLLALGLVTAGCDFDGAHDLPLPGSVVSADESFEVTAIFSDVLNVVPRSPVMVSDVAVGEVTDVERAGWQARVRMRIRDDIELPDNAVAEIRQTSLLGEKYVALEEPGDGSGTGRLSDGDEIRPDATSRNPEVEEVLGALSFLLSGGGVGQLGTITQELNTVMSGRTDRVKNLLHELDGVVGTLDEQKADIVRALEAVNSLSGTLNAEKQTIDEALTVMGPAVKVLSSQHDELMAMLAALDELGVVGTRVINASKKDLLRVLEDLGPVLAKLNEAGDSLPRGLSLLISFPFPKEASEVVKGDFANTEIKVDISLENILGPNPLIPNLPLPDLDEVLKDVTACLASGNLASASCQKVLADVNLLNTLITECKRPENSRGLVCTVLGTLNLGNLGGLGNLLGGNGRAGGLYGEHLAEEGER